MEITESGKVKVVGVRFRTAGKIYYFDPGNFELSRGCHVVVETARGMEYGFVVGPPMEVDEAEIQQPLKGVIRISTEEDDEHEKKNREREREAFRICRERIMRRGLEMKLIDAEYTFDNSKVLFYFTADGRVDFRELVKDLAGVFRTRIELRQVGVRDETKILGGYGSCGRPLCCHTWLSDFVPVSIKMAKEQNLSLNPGKISGVCGRLMCCLKNEAETYEELNKTLPHPGDEVESANGMNGLVESVNILRQTARIIVEVDDEKELHEYAVSDLTILRRRRRGTSRPTIQKNTPPKNNTGGKQTSAKEGKDSKDNKDIKDNKDNRDVRDSKDTRDARESRDNRESKDNRDSRGSSYGGRTSGSRDSSSREGGRNNSSRDNASRENFSRDNASRDNSSRENPDKYSGREYGSRENPNRENPDRYTGRANTSAANTDRNYPGDASAYENEDQGNAGRENAGRDRGRRDRGRKDRGDRRQDRRPHNNPRKEDNAE